MSYPTLMEKKKVSKEEYRQVIDEILGYRKALTKTFDEYTVNAIDRLIIAKECGLREGSGT
jgi:hypothetical protein